MARTSTVFDQGSISGERILPLFTEEHEGFDINTPYDWMIAEQLAKQDGGILPEIPGDIMFEKQGHG